MNLAYSITQWLLTLFFGPLLGGLVNLVFGVNFFGPFGGMIIYFYIVLISVLFSLPALLIHLFFNWLFFTNHFNVFFIKSALILLAFTVILVSLVGFMDFDVDDSLVIGYGLAALISGVLLPVVEKEVIEDN